MGWLGGWSKGERSSNCEDERCTEAKPSRKTESAAVTLKGLVTQEAQAGAIESYSAETEQVDRIDSIGFRTKYQYIST